MNNKAISRRSFLRTLGIGSTAGLLLANGGLPLALAGDRRFETAADIRGAALHTEAGMSPAVELLIGDVLGFALTSDAWEAAFGWVTFQLHKAFYDGDMAYYIRTDASDLNYANEHHLVHVPLLVAGLSAEGATSQLYTFTNGADEQYPVMSAIPDQDTFSSAWHVHNVTFSGSATVLDSVDAIMAAEAAGDITIEAMPLVVNFPVVKWPGGELAEDTDKTTYLGTGPLISPVDVDAMQVTFKLHECYPGSRYIVTDTSAVPMAPMMSIAGSGPSQGLANVGAVDEIWVFGNGIPGSGVMGFQPAIFDHSAGNPLWSPFWHHFTAVWTDESTATLVTSSEELRELEASGALQIFKGVPDMDQAMPAFVVNCPVPIKAHNTFSHDDGMM
jgi:hypothetical protein